MCSSHGDNARRTITLRYSHGSGPITTGGQARTLQPLDVLAQIEPAVLAVMTVE